MRFWCEFYGEVVFCICCVVEWVWCCCVFGWGVIVCVLEVGNVLVFVLGFGMLYCGVMVGI